MSDLSAVWSSWMAGMLVQSSLLIAAVGGFDLLFGRRVWPQLRGALWLLVLVRLFVPPGLHSPVGVTPAHEAGVTAAADAPSLLWLAVWLAGMLLIGAFAWRRLRAVRRILLAGEQPPPPHVEKAWERAVRVVGLARPPRLLVSAAARNPAAFGAWRTFVVLPASLPVEDVEHVLLHELMHVKRRDLPVQAFWSLAHLLYWFHPLLFLARRRAYALREICCDARVAGALGPRAAEYRATLLRSARALLVPGGAAFGYPASILARLRWLHRGSGRTWLRRPATVLALLLAACTLLPGSALPVPVLTPLEQAQRALNAAIARGECTTLKYHMWRIHMLEQKQATNP